MEDFKEALKQVMKTELRATVSSSLVKQSGELLASIQGIINSIVEWEWDQRKVDLKTKVAAEAMTEIAVTSLIERICKDAISHAKPRIEEALEVVRRMMHEATSEAIGELLHEEVDRLHREQDNATP